ncbi:cytochrome c oxidase subunit II [Roseisolibacter sp. H3M3-2]|uniref:cytochrome c oxidase subunit II n=1 Tax=Roseisolibacter sp. H3M3-2 TaxID=3031323 RepID=UPI0023D9BA1D|nr:cytochrome c oxidase subunit II [Roseisolibacter sp. H3M3-2]MDF1503467.1 cytochrome c oxidase subunit II [Roseisolibacter sp. H3M3-2]
MSVARRARGLAAAPLLLAGCSLNRFQSALDPAGTQASRIERLWWLAPALAAPAYPLTMAALAVATGRRGRAPALPRVEPSPAAERRATRWVAAATGATVVVLFVFLAADLFTGRALLALGRGGDRPLHVRVTGVQWWWRVEYRDPAPGRSMTTANELRIPVGRPVVLELETEDVIHSFWVPALHGKRDHVPGRHNTLTLRADRPGVYRGQCAEYCGLQHAKMGIDVVAMPPRAFDAWYAGQLADAAPPADSLRAEGMRAFLSGPCAACHAVRGTPASAQSGPDLTHVASRRSLAAGTLPNTRGHLAGWIVDPQSLKPGTYMPPNDLPAPALRALLAYVEGLR